MLFGAIGLCLRQRLPTIIYEKRACDEILGHIIWNVLDPNIHNLATADSLALLFKQLQTHLCQYSVIVMGTLLSDSSEEVLTNNSVYITVVFNVFLASKYLGR